MIGCLLAACPLWDCYDIEDTAVARQESDESDEYDYDSDEDYYGSYDSAELEDYFSYE